MLIKKPADIPYSEVTPKGLYLRRREFIQAAAAGAIGGAIGLSPFAVEALNAQAARTKLPNVRKSPLSTSETVNSFEDATGYNNFYEFGTDKEDPKANAQKFVPKPWTIKVDGLVKSSGHHRPRHLHQAVRARGAHLPDAMRRRLVDGDSVGRVPAR